MRNYYQKLNHIREYSVEAFADGSTWSGAGVGIKAKFLELFQKDWNKVKQNYSSPNELLTRIEELKQKVNNASGDGQSDVSYIPIKDIAPHILVDGEIIKNPVRLAQQLNRVVDFVKIKNTHFFTSWKKFITNLTVAIENDQTKEKMESLLKELNIKQFESFTNKELLGGVSIGIFEDSDKEFKGLQHIQYSENSYRTDPYSTHVKTYTKEECIKVLEACEKILKELIDYLPEKDKNEDLVDAKKLNEVMFQPMQKLSNIVEQNDNDAIAIGFKLFKFASTHIYEPMVEHGVFVTVTVKAVLRIIEASIRRFH